MYLSCSQRLLSKPYLTNQVHYTIHALEGHPLQASRGTLSTTLDIVTCQTPSTVSSVYMSTAAAPFTWGCRVPFLLPIFTVAAAALLPSDTPQSSAFNTTKSCCTVHCSCSTRMGLACAIPPLRLHCGSSSPSTVQHAQHQANSICCFPQFMHCSCPVYLGLACTLSSVSLHSCLSSFPTL